MTDVTDKTGKVKDSSSPDATGSGQLPVGDTQITMTPAQLDARLERERAKLKKQYADYEDLMAAKKELDELKKAQMGEAERLQAEVAEAQRKIAEAEAARQRAELEAQDTLIKAAFVAEASKAGALFPEDAFDLADIAGVAIGEDGKVLGVAEAVKVLVEAGRLPLSGKPRAPSLDAGAGTGDRTGDSPKLTSEELIVAKKMGLTPEQYAKYKK